MIHLEHKRDTVDVEVSGSPAVVAEEFSCGLSDFVALIAAQHVRSGKPGTEAEWEDAVLRDIITRTRAKLTAKRKLN